ncbi:MAG: 3-deoxy-manno-octulosonate cytidylyltransferase [Alphaproteobacteria bacterium]|nr:3-deoxy-manno-octulosonate cytidylyltransferase [Alphaproteobacteria bacterium]
MKTAIIIPARYGSSRFPGKPLAKIGGRSMLSRVVEIVRAAAAGRGDVSLMVATEDARIADHCAAIGVDCIMTSDRCRTGSDRVLEAAETADGGFDFLMSLQGDAPFTPPTAMAMMLDAVADNPEIAVVTPVIKLRWAELDALREAKRTTPFSGTTAILDESGRARWFSKNIIPAIRKEETLRADGDFSPVYQHIGLYGYRTDVLKRFVALPEGNYERLEGLEQLRFLENDIPIQTVTIAVDAGLAQAGIDSPEDIERAERFLEHNAQ